MAGKEEVKRTPNAQRPTPSVELGEARTSSFNPQPSSFRRFFWRLVAFLIGALFIYAGVVKIMDPVEFARDIDNYKLAPWKLGVWLALYLPWLEILCGLALITRILYRGSVFIVTGLMFLFIVASIVAKARGLDVSCGCFGHASKYLSFSWHLVLDFLLLGGLLVLWKRTSPAT